MSLDEYREQLIGRLKTCADTAAARTLLAEAELVIVNARLALPTQSRFWESVHKDLDALVEAVRLSADREAGMKLAAVVAAAQACIARNRERLADASK
jgi:hypothetical protein